MAEIVAAFLAGLVLGAIGKSLIERKVIVRLDGSKVFDPRVQRRRLG